VALIPKPFKDEEKGEAIRGYKRGKIPADRRQPPHFP